MRTPHSHLSHTAPCERVDRYLFLRLAPLLIFSALALVGAVAGSFGGHPVTERRPLARAETIWLEVEQVEQLGVSRSTIYRRVRADEWRSRQQNGRQQIALEALPDKVQARYWSRRNGKQVQPVRDFDQGSNRLSPEVRAHVIAAHVELLQHWASLPRDAKRDYYDGPMAERWGDVPIEAKAFDHLVRLPAYNGLYRLWKRVQEQGPQAVLGYLSKRRVEAGTTLCAEAQGFVSKLWLIDQARTMRIVYRAYRQQAKRSGWEVLSYATVARHLKSLPRDVVARARQGQREFSNASAPYLPRDMGSFAVGELLVGDHHQFDVFVRDAKGKATRPWLTGWQDQRTRALPGWHICWTPNSKTITHAFVHAIMPKRRPEYALMCGLPTGVLIDNGRDYRSKALQRDDKLSESDQQTLKGLFPGLGLETRYARAYNPKDKTIERFFRDVALDFSASMPGYCGSSPDTKPERLEHELAAHKAWREGKRNDTPLMTIEELTERFEKWLFRWHQRAHAGLSDGRDLAPLDVYRLEGKPRAVPSDKALYFLLCEGWTRSIQKAGLSLLNGWYWAEALAARPLGERVAVRLDPEESGRAYVFTLTGEFICEAQCLPRLEAHATIEQVREAQARINAYMRDTTAAIKQLTEVQPTEALSLADALTDGIADEPEAPQPELATVTRLVPADRLARAAHATQREEGESDLVLFPSDVGREPAPADVLVFAPPPRVNVEEDDELALYPSDLELNA